MKTRRKCRRTAISYALVASVVTIVVVMALFAGAQRSPNQGPRPTEPQSIQPVSPGPRSPTEVGVPAGTVLRASGPVIADSPGQVIDSLDIHGQVIVEATGVVIKNSKIHGKDSNGIYVRSGDVTVIDSEIFGFENGIAFDNWSARRVNIHGTTGDGVKLGSNVVLEESWIHDLSPGPDAHADGGQMQSGVAHLTVRRNTIDLAGTANANAALFLAPDLGPSSEGPVIIEANYLDGGNYSLYCVDGANGTYSVFNISIVGNRFGRHSLYGPWNVNVPITQQNNVWADSGLPLTL